MTPTPISQADREAAADLAVLVYGARIAQSIRSGASDEHHFVQAFARHAAQARARAVEECLLVIRDCMAHQEWPPSDGDRQIDEVLAAVRKLRPAGVTLNTSLSASDFPALNNTKGEGE